jgi:hypothetical protein
MHVKKSFLEGYRRRKKSIVNFSYRGRASS